MSFDAFRSYGRSILRPLGLADQKQISKPRSARLPQTTSPLWEATTHTFVGVRNRAASTAWPASRFSEDPNAIPNDAKHGIIYDPSTANVRANNDSPDAAFWLYERETDSTGADGKSTDEDVVPPPLIVVKRYIPTAKQEKKNDGPGLTLLMLPGMGVPKEMCEPIIENILPELQSARVAVDEIWTVDMPLSGETALANPPGYFYGNEKDITRDLLHFITAYMPLKAGEQVPEMLPVRNPKRDGRQPVRPNLHVIAHSLGAQAAMLASAHAPEVFASLTVFDPAIVPPGKILDGFRQLPNDVFCTMIPERLPSREALREAIKKNKRTGGWDDRIVKVYVERGAMDDKQNGGIRLISPPRLEWALYYDKETPTHTFDRIPDIRVPINAVMPARPFATPPKVFEQLINGLPQKTRLVWIPKTTHQVVYERLDECSKHIVDWLKEQANTSSARL